MQVYPIMLKLQHRRVLVVGAGRVGMRKVRSLLDAGAKVTLVADRLPPDAELAGVEVHHRPYEPHDVAGAALVFACTGERATNARIAADARTAGALVNAVDQPEDCDFYAPAVERRGEVVVAVGTGGTAPPLAAAIRDRLADALPANVGDFAGALGSLRDTIQGRVRDPHRRSALLRRLAGAEGARAFDEKGDAGLGALLEALLQEQ